MAGATWNYNGSQCARGSPRMWFHPAQATTILLGNDGGMYRSTTTATSGRFFPGFL